MKHMFLTHGEAFLFYFIFFEAVWAVCQSPKENPSPLQTSPVCRCTTYFDRAKRDRMYMFAINTSPRGRELEEGIPNDLCRILDGVCVFVCVCVFSIPSKNTEKSLSPWAHCSPHVAACWPRFRRSGLFEQTVLWPLERNVWGRRENWW